MKNINPFRSYEASNFFYKMSHGILEKLEANYPNLDKVILECPDEPSEHLMHMIYAIVGFLSTPQIEVTMQTVANKLSQIENDLKADGCIIRREFLAQLFVKIQKSCKGEIKAWHDLQIIAAEQGLYVIDEDLIKAKWSLIPDNDGESYEDLDKEEHEEYEAYKRYEADMDYYEAYIDYEDTTPRDILEYIAFCVEGEIEDGFGEDVEPEVIDKVICVILQALAEDYVLENVAEMAKGEALVAGFDIDDGIIIRLVQRISNKCERYINLTKSAANLLKAGEPPYSVLKKVQQALDSL